VQTTRLAIRRRAILLQAGLLAYNLGECVIALVAGVAADSLALIGFGVDSAVEIAAGGVILIHLKRSRGAQSPAWERGVTVFVGVTLLVLALYLFNDAVLRIALREEPDASTVGLLLAVASLLVMPRVASMQARLASQLGSTALAAGSRETLVCALLSGVLLAGLAANAWLGWWWADPVAAVAMVAFVGREGWEAVSAGLGLRLSARTQSVADN
jgi:divalent metal cation (Fe/Co/Zn/Cd) transporter